MGAQFIGLPATVDAVAAVQFIVAGGAPANAIKLNAIIGPAERCRWEKRCGTCYVDAVCVRRNKRGRCKRAERRRVCESRDVRVCY